MRGAWVRKGGREKKGRGLQEDYRLWTNMTHEEEEKQRKAGGGGQKGGGRGGAREQG